MVFEMHDNIISAKINCNPQVNNGFFNYQNIFSSYAVYPFTKLNTYKIQKKTLKILENSRKS